MRVLLLNQVFYPDVAATAQHAHDLAKHLVSHGHEVTAIASRSLYGQKGASLPKREVVDGVRIIRVGKSLFGKAGILARVADFALFYVFAAWKVLFGRRHDVIVCFTTPPFIALVGWMLRLVRRTRTVYWVMDLYPDLPVACGVMKPRGLSTRFFEGLNRFCLKRADRTVVLGRCMLERVLSKGVKPDHVIHIGVWSDQDEVKPIARHENPYREEWNLGDRFTVMYSGNFGLGHDVDTMCRAAEALKDDDSIRFVFAGGGKKKELVDAFVKEKGLTNCVLAPYQPRERLDASLSVANLHLATLLEGVEGIMVPCKLFGIMAAARPCVFIGHPSSELSRVLGEFDAGVTVRQGDAEGLVCVIRDLAADRTRTEAMGENARRALALAFSRHDACERWRLLLEDVAEKRKREAWRVKPGAWTPGREVERVEERPVPAMKESAA
ncbi:MAG: glycosyltransferase family 4 protein [Phycisphaeraceae bacterium]|nr:glycosyltransferase family 4 protein [Phycisphaeraceae bacterium]